MFSLRKPYFLGIDFGTSYIKAVELTIKDGVPVLINYGSAEMGFTEGENAHLADRAPERLVHQYLCALLDKFRPKASSASFSLPGFSGLITLIELPDMDEKDMEQAVRFEAQKYIPAALSDVAFSWEVAGRLKRDGKLIVEVLLVAALKKEVVKYEQYIVGTQIGVDMLELEVFPLVRAVVGDRSDTVLIVDIGSRATNLVLVENGTVHMNRNLSAGGNEITSTLSKALNISWNRAEELKRESKDYLNNHRSELTFPTLDLIVGEMSRIFELYKKNRTDRSIAEIILSGGTAAMSGLPEYLSSRLDTAVSVADPWQNIFVEEVVRDSAVRISPSFAIAIGLALGGVERFRKL